jgi:hypothetical protein
LRQRQDTESQDADNRTGGKEKNVFTSRFRLRDRS